LEERLVSSGVKIEATAVESVRPLSDGALVDHERFDCAVLAVPAPLAAHLLGEDAPEEMGRIRLTDVALVTAELARDELPIADDVNGILVAPSEGALMTACSFGSNKWPHWADRPDRAVVRISSGRSGDRRASALPDAELADRLLADLGRALGARLIPSAVRVSRWPAAFPLYEVGHLQRVERMEAELSARAPRIKLAGSSYRGAGIPACITSGRQAAAALLA
jgi:oxygen-dependent protoporphyrinogen oxidase